MIWLPRQARDKRIRKLKTWLVFRFALQGGLTIAHVWDMTEMPPNTPVPTAPTYPNR
eukprot:COSAG06_NODE_5751_length_3293_cov_2.735128_3_plen_57_part_00